MVVIFYGTGAELIKLLGVVRDIPRDQMLLICTAQQRAGLAKLHPQLGIEPDIYLAQGWKGSDIANMKQMVIMMLTAHMSFIGKYLSIKKQIKNNDKQNGTKSVVVVHGDTLSTVVGSYLGRLLWLPVAHIEAGLRSGAWNNPFPEELDRRIATKLARIHFPPNSEAEKNLQQEKAKGEIVPTHFNTAKDAIEIADQFVSKDVQNLRLPKHYCLVLLHRTELLENKADLEAILRVLYDHASPKTPVVFTGHTTTLERIDNYGLKDLLKKDGFQLIPKQPYFDFMAIVKKADYIVTDGGGLQEDAFFLGIPTIIHRQRTERNEGLGLNADISRMDTKKVAGFLKNHKDKKEFTKMKDKVSPSKVVVGYFREKKFI